tara:strand:+ start:1565 stop:1933 length:369 start_codon:yes stop_codon:yes gene_type:complete
MKNLKVYETLLIVSILMNWTFSFFVKKISPEKAFKHLEFLENTGAILSLFFYTMIVLTIQALVHNVNLLEGRVIVKTPERRIRTAAEISESRQPVSEPIGVGGIIISVLIVSCIYGILKQIK